MHDRTGSINNNTSVANANNMPLSEPNKEPEAFFDNRPESIRLRKMIEFINKSGRVAQLKSYQEMADKGLKNNLTSPTATVQAMFRARDTRTPDQKNQDEIINCFQQGVGYALLGTPYSLATPSQKWDHTAYFRFIVITPSQNQGIITAHVHYNTQGTASAGSFFLEGDNRGAVRTPPWLVTQNQTMPPLGNRPNASSAVASGNTTGATSSASAASTSAASGNITGATSSASAASASAASGNITGASSSAYAASASAATSLDQIRE